MNSDSIGMSAAETGADEVDGLPAVFWDKMPTNKDNVDLAAINALIDEQTPVERAESHKVVVNAAAPVLSCQLDIDLHSLRLCRIRAMRL